MYLLINVTFLFLNMGITIGLVIGALLLLRPALVRILSPQKRAWLWTAAWFPAYLPQLYGITSLLFYTGIPFSFPDLISPRVTGSFNVPSYFPNYYSGTKDYNLFLPGGQMIQTELQEDWMTLLSLIWLAGALGLTAYGWYRGRCLLKRARQGRLLAHDDPMMEHIRKEYRENTLVYVCSGLPTSFVRSGSISVDKTMYTHEIFLQEELSPEQMKLVLCHEARHIDLNHCIWKGYANIGLYLYWWNPVVWLGYRYFCRDLELACDKAVLDELDKEERRDYARALVEIGSGRQLWEAPLSFGECDAQLRVKAAVSWRPSASRWSVKNIAGVALTLGLMLFFLAGPKSGPREEDMQLVWDQQVLQSETIRFRIHGLDNSGRSHPLELTQLWVRPGTADKELGPYYGLDTDGTWWTFKLLWVSKMEYQAISLLTNPNAAGLIERGELVQVK